MFKHAFAVVFCGALGVTAVGPALAQAPVGPVSPASPVARSPSEPRTLEQFEKALAEIAGVPAGDRLWSNLDPKTRGALLQQIEQVERKIPEETQYPVSPVTPRPPPPPPKPNPKKSEWDGALREMYRRVQTTGKESPTKPLSPETADALQQIVDSLKAGRLEPKP